MIGTWLELLFKELVVLALLWALGSGLAVFARGDGLRGNRAALAPAFGFALAASLSLTATFFISGTTAAWAVLAPALIISVSATVWKRRRDGDPILPRTDWRLIAQFVVIVAVVTSAFNYPLAKRDSL